MAYRTRRPPQNVEISAGPWSGVLTTSDPYDDATETLYDAVNLYLPDPSGRCGAYARPGFTLQAGPLETGGTFRGQGVFTHVDIDGTITNFCVIKGVLYRADASFTIFTNVTPTGCTISALAEQRVYGVQFGNEFVVTDGVNRPWLMTAFTATPVTATEIEFNAASDDWSAYGKPTVYGGSLFFIVNEVDGTFLRSTIAWSNPADAATGYDQLNYDFTWTIFATGISPITAIQGTNTSLYYGTQNSIGEIAGAVGPNLQSTATTASISVNVGMAIPQTVVLFGQTVFFCDYAGRPYMLPVGGQPVAIYLQMRKIIDDSNTSGYPGVTLQTATATFEPSFNKYLVAIFSSASSNAGPPVEMYSFDARSGKYEGRWMIGEGVQIETLGTFLDANGRGTLISLGSLVAPSGTSLAASGYVWSMNGVTALGEGMTIENGNYLTIEDGTFLQTEGNAASWLDNGEVPRIEATTNRMGYSATEMLHCDRAQVVVGSQAPITVSMETSATDVTVESTPTPTTAYDDMYRAVAGADIVGRGLVVTVSPTTADGPWSVQRIDISATVSTAAPDDA